jgi:hypothetical protein
MKRGSSPKELLKNWFMEGINTRVFDPLCFAFLKKVSRFFELTPFCSPSLRE